MGINRGPNIVKDGLVLALDAASKRSYPGSGTLWKDLSRDGNDCTINNATHDLALPGKFIFDAASERNTLPSTYFNTPTSMSMSAWFNMTGGSGTYRCVLHKGSGTSVGSSSFWIGVSGAGNLVATIGANNGIGWVGGDTGIPAVLGKWYNMSAVWNGSTVRVFKDGVFIKAYALTSYVDPNIDLTRIGASGDTGSYQVIGEISTVNMYYNTALSDDEIKQNFNAQKGRFNL